MAENTRKIQEEQILKLQKEGFMSRAMKSFVKVLSGTNVKRKMRKLDKDIRKDPEVQAALHDYWDTRDRLKDQLKGFCDRHPDSSLCKSGRG